MTVTHITIPASLDEAITSLTGLDGLLTAKRWERAAIVWAFTRNNGPGRPVNDGNPTFTKTQAEFARLGISGLTMRETVARYREAWQAAIDAGQARAVHPGQVTELPDMDWNDAAPRLRDERPSKQDIPLRDAPADQARAVTEMLANPAVAAAAAPAIAQAIKASPEAAGHAITAFDEMEQERRERNTHAAPRSERGEHGDGDEFLTVSGDLMVIRRKLIDVAHLLARSTAIHTSEKYQRMVLLSVQSNRERLDVIEEIAKGGETMDDALERISAAGGDLQ